MKYHFREVLLLQKVSILKWNVVINITIIISGHGGENQVNE